MSVYYVIFGAAVKPDGRPSGTLLRRIQGALADAKGRSGVRFMPTGTRGATGFVEAEVIRTILLAAGIAPEAITLESNARDTLESVRFCDALLRQAGDAQCVVPCTSRYHLLRCTLLLRLLGWRVRRIAVPSDFGELSNWKLLYFYLREFAALPYDVALILANRHGRTEL